MPEVIMPKMGDAMTEGKVLRWMKQPGDQVAKGEPIVEIETDKVNVDLEADWDGVLAQVLVGDGETAAVGAPIAFVARPGEKAPQPAAVAPPGAGAAAGPEVEARAVQRGEPAGIAEPPRDVPTEVRASPLARRLAQQQGIPLASIRGTGPKGRITREDVEAFVAASRAAAAAPPPAVAAAAGEVPLSRMRQAIARRMTDSKQQAPHFYVTASIAMDAALALRQQINDRLDDARKVSVNDLIVKAAALALVRHPGLNASYSQAGIRYHSEINVGIAVAMPDGLVVLTVYGPDRKALWQIASESRAVVERARAGRLRPEDLTGGTFTVSNLGMFGVDAFTAIINPPQAAVLAVGAARPQAVVEDGRVAVATVLQATLSADHRVTDGAEAARYLDELRRLLENPVWLVAGEPEV